MTALETTKGNLCGDFRIPEEGKINEAYRPKLDVIESFL